MGHSEWHVTMYCIFFCREAFRRRGKLYLVFEYVEKVRTLLQWHNQLTCDIYKYVHCIVTLDFLVLSLIYFLCPIEHAGIA
jgi:hypothetical protein